MSRPTDYGFSITRDLSKDREFFRFGNRVENVVVSNATAQARTIAIDAFSAEFYVPQHNPGDGRKPGARRYEETYFYLRCPANYSVSTGPFFPRRGLVVRSQGNKNVDVAVVVAPESPELSQVYLDNRKDLKTPR